MSDVKWADSALPIYHSRRECRSTCSRQCKTYVRLVETIEEKQQRKEGQEQEVEFAQCPFV